ncbi:YidB family protein (plasmid) [Sinorhizobium sp. B11]
MMSGPLKALLGVIAVAGYQNRDKIGELLRGIQNPQRRQDARPTTSGEAPGGLDGIFGGPGGFGDLLGGLSTGGILSGGLGELLKTFQQNGHGEKAESWVSPGSNSPIDGGQLSEALGPDILSELAAKTGLSHQEILERLSRDLPKAVDDLTPNGKLPEGEDDLPSSGSNPAGFDTKV